MVRRTTPLAAAVAFVTLVVATASGATGERHAAIYSVRFDGTGRTLVTNLDPPVYSLLRLPGGKKIAFTRPDGLYVADITGANAVRINAPAGEPKFSPDGSRLAVTTSSECGWRCLHTMLYVVNVDGTGLRLIADGGRHPSWSPDGTRLAYMAVFKIHVVSATGEEDTTIADGMNPAWAPRGNRIAYLGTGRGYGPPCFIDADGSNRRCTHGFTAVNDIVWAPNAKWLAFMQATPSRLGVVRPDASEIRRFPVMKLRARPLAWSPNGRWLAYSKGLAEKQIYVRPVLRDGVEHRVTNEDDQPFYGDVRWRDGRLSYVIFVP
jgi:Tol biopolymer transport system component